MKDRGVRLRAAYSPPLARRIATDPVGATQHNGMPSMSKAKAKSPKNIEYIPLADLHFDPQNPRFPRTLKAANEEAVIEWMLNDASIIELMGAIGEKGYFPGEPLLVAKSKKNGYHVVEGNRRLTALKLLANPSLATVKKRAVAAAAENANEHPSDIPTLVFDSRSEILGYLGYRHITGIKEWDPLEKARYLKQLYDSEKTGTEEERLRAVARTIGSRSDYVARLLAGLAAYELAEEKDFFGLKLKADEIDFAVLTTAINYTNIAQYVGFDSGLKNFDPKKLHEEALAKLIQWMFERDSERRTVLGESRRLGTLNDVLGSAKARARLESGASLSAAASLTKDPIDGYRSAVATATDQLRAARDQVHLITGATGGDLENVAEIVSLGRTLQSAVKDRIAAQEEATAETPG